MEQIYLAMWEKAKPYYEKGRVYDLDQVSWMMIEGERIAEIENVDKKLLLPIIILHDVGYSVVGQKNPHIKDKNVKELHMREGAKIAKKILEHLNYDAELTKKIVYYISKHDNWVLGDDTPFQECKEMALFNDLEFLYVTSSHQAFKYCAESMKLSEKKFYNFWQKDEKLTRRPFCCAETRKMWKQTMEKFRKLILQK
jgi:hypothetical protein